MAQFIEAIFRVRLEHLSGWRAGVSGFGQLILTGARQGQARRNKAPGSIYAISTPGVAWMASLE